MEFYTQWDRPEKVCVEINSGEIRVEKAGYISAQKRIENLIDAGRRLIASRSEQYDFQEGQEVDLEYVDMTRSKNVDRVDIDQAAAYLDQKAKIKAKDLKEKAKEKDVQKKDIDQELQEMVEDSKVK